MFNRVFAENDSCKKKMTEDKSLINVISGENESVVEINKFERKGKRE